MVAHCSRDHTEIQLYGQGARKGPLSFSRLWARDPEVPALECVLRKNVYAVAFCWVLHCIEAPERQHGAGFMGVSTRGR